jgi:hypothetical protein
VYIPHNIDGIPVGGVNIDSTWSECINNFKFDKKKFPHPETIAPYFHSQNIKVILVSQNIFSGRLQLSIKNALNISKEKVKGIF